MRVIDISSPNELRSGMIFRTEQGRGAGSYMIISNDIDVSHDDWEDRSKWLVIWFMNNKHSMDSPGLSFHGRGIQEEPRTIFQLFNWIDDDACVGYIHRDVVQDLLYESGLDGERR